MRFSVVTLRGGAVRSTRLRLPVEFFRVLLRERRMEPTPLTYLMAAGIGCIIGLVLDFSIGWAWWIVAIAFLSLVWLFFLSSALPGRRDDLGHD